MAVTLEELQIKFTAQMGNLSSQLNGVKTQINGITSSVKGTSSAFTGMARAAKLFIGAFVIRGMVKIGKTSLEMANNVVESESLFAVSMKGMADEARKWSDELSDSLGLNAYTLRRNVGTFNTMFMSMGLGEKAAYDMSTSLVQLAEDMASFYNVDPEEMFTKLRAGITGETEPLKRLGIMVDEQTVKQYALSEGISTTGKNLTQTEKLMARYAAIMAQTSNAQGDLARTIDSPVNQIRLLNNQLDMAKIALGQAFMPIQATVLPILTALANAATTAAQALAYLMGSLGGFGGVGIFASSVAASGAEANQDLADSLKDSAKAYKAAGGAAKKASSDAKVGLKAFDEINKLTEETTKTGGGAGGGIDEVDVPDIEPASEYADALQVISDKVRNVAAAIKEFWEGLKNSALGTIVEGAFGALKWLWTDVIKPFGEWAIANPDVIGNVLGGIGAAIAVWEIGKLVSGANGVSGIAGALAALGRTIAAHPVLFSLATIAGGLVFLAGSINSAREAAIREENENRFGSLALSLEKLRNAVSSIRTPFSAAMSNLRSDFIALAQAGQQLKALADSNAELVYGYRLKPEAFTKEKADELIKSVQDEVDLQSTLLESAQIKATMGLEALFAGTSQDGSEILKLNAENWEKVKEQGAKLGKEYLDAVTDAAFDGKISAEEQQKIYTLQAKMLEMMMIATDPEALIARMEIRKIGMGFDGATLTPESVKDFNQALDEKADELMELVDKEGKSVIDYSLAVAIQANPSITNAELKNVQSTTQKALDEQRLKAEWEIEQVRISAPFGEVQKAYKDVLKGAKPAVDALGKDYMTTAIEYMLKSGFTADRLNTRDGSRTLGIAISTLMYDGVKEAQIPEGATKDAMRRWVETFRPDYIQWKDMEAEYKRLGLNIPTALADGIYNYEAMLAVSGSISDMANYVAEQDIIDTTTWSSEGKAAIDAIITEFNRGAIDIRTAASRISEVIELEAYINATPWTEQGKKVVAGIMSELANGKISVQEAAERLAQAAKDGLDNVSLYDVGKDMADGFISGMKSKTDNVVRAGESLSNAAKKAMKAGLSISSPSKVTTEFGRYFGEGFVIGIGDMANQVYTASERLAQDAAAGLNSTAMSASSALTVEDSGFASAISNGIEQGVQRVMNALNITLNVDGETWGRASVKHINNAQRMSGKLLLEM